MIERFIKRTPDQFDKVNDKLFAQMDIYDVDDEEFTRAVSLMERMSEIQARKAGPRISRDTMAIVAGNLVGIIIMCTYEQTHAATSKGFSMLLRPKSSVTS